MTKQLLKQEQQANKIVSNAVGTFSQAITEVEKANVLLTKSVVIRNAEMERLTKQIEDAYKLLDIEQAEKLNALARINANKDLIAKLEQFTV